MDATMTPAALTELAERAVADSRDRPTWLLARSRGVTATEVAKGKTITARNTIIAEKIAGKERDLSRARAARWGTVREEYIADWSRRRFNVEPNSMLFRSESEPRHLATPDAVGVDFDEQLCVAEIKTSEDDLTPGPTLGGILQMELVDDGWRKKPFWSKGYYDQVQWQIYVTGAAYSRFIWEQHDADWSRWPEFGPTPLEAEPRTVVILRDDYRIDQLVERAGEMLAALDAARDGVEPAEVDEDLDTAAVNYLAFLEAEKTAVDAKKTVWAELQERAAAKGVAFTQETTLARVTFSPGEETVSVVTDFAAAQLADPDLFKRMNDVRLEWESFAAGHTKEVVTVSRSTLRVTPVKTKEMGA